MGLHVFSIDAPEINITSLSITLIMITVAPAAIGLAWRRCFEDSALALEPRLMRISQVLFWTILFATATTGWETVKVGVADIGPVLVFLALVLIGTAWAVAKIAGLPAEDRITIAIETGVQNSGAGLAALAVLFTVDNNLVPEALVPLGLDVLIILAITVPLVYTNRALMLRT